MEEKLNQLKTILAQVSDLNHANALLEWDQQVFMPEEGAVERGEQSGTLSEIAHNLFVSDEVGSLLENLASYSDQLDPDSDVVRLVKVTKRNFDKETRIPVDLLVRLSKVTAVAHGVWAKARQNDDFKAFQPQLEIIIDLVKEMADCFKPYDHIYDPLLDTYEPGMKTADVKLIFDELRPQQVELIKAIAQSKQVDDDFLNQFYDSQKQWQFGVKVAEAFGMDWKRSRQDLSAHPFTTSFGQNDVRITTKILDHKPTSSLFSTMHETGHALYELGFNPLHRHTPLSNSCSLAFHESQSRMWENLVGRSRPFWEHFYPEFKSLFIDQLDGVDLETFYKGINKVETSLIRIEADEATYNLHIMLRLELEIELMEGSLLVKDLPDAWNSRMQSYLGLTPPNDADGVLQDVHWSSGLIGYFPTYALGNLISAQLWEKMHFDMPDLDDKIGQGSFNEMLDWLRRNIHSQGAKYEPQELIKKITGSKIDAKPYVNYLAKKYKEIYDIF
jgi:carboxypeptidase Taq